MIADDWLYIFQHYFKTLLVMLLGNGFLVFFRFLFDVLFWIYFFSLGLIISFPEYEAFKLSKNAPEIPIAPLLPADLNLQIRSNEEEQYGPDGKVKNVPNERKNFPPGIKPLSRRWSNINQKVYTADTTDDREWQQDQYADQCVVLAKDGLDLLQVERGIGGRWLLRKRLTRGLGDELFGLQTWLVWWGFIFWFLLFYHFIIETWMSI